MLSTGAAAYVVTFAGRGAAGFGCLILGANFKAADQPAVDLDPDEGPAAAAFEVLAVGGGVGSDCDMVSPLGACD